MSGNRSQMGIDLEARPDMADRPLPDVNHPFSKPFWEGCQRHELVLQRCSACGKFRYYPRPFCPECRTPEYEWTRCSGLGSVYSFTIVHRPLTRWFKGRVPLVCAVVELEEGTRMMSNVVGTEPEAVRVGMPVRVDFEDVTEDITLPMFRPA
jgi:uncharacterized protein